MRTPLSSGTHDFIDVPDEQAGIRKYARLPARRCVVEYQAQVHPDRVHVFGSDAAQAGELGNGSSTRGCKRGIVCERARRGCERPRLDVSRRAFNESVERINVECASAVHSAFQVSAKMLSSCVVKSEPRTQRLSRFRLCVMRLGCRPKERVLARESKSKLFVCSIEVGEILGADDRRLLFGELQEDSANIRMPHLVRVETFVDEHTEPLGHIRIREARMM